MKEIKFRAWYKPKEKMYTKSLESINFETKVLGVYTIKEGYQQLRISDFELMQYTGLKDKNGKEIYEGDIVQFTVNKFGSDGLEKTIKNGLVYYNDEMSLSVDGWILARVKSREVIGNIYKNPELVTA